MTVDACSIFDEVIGNQAIIDYSLSCNKFSFSKLISFYTEALNCVECSNLVKCINKKEKVCNNVMIETICCNLCIYPNNDPNFNCIYPNNTIVDVKMISPNNETQCQE